MSDIIQHPSINLVIGRRRFGKSALGHYILQKFHIEKPELQLFVVSLPKEKHYLLPDWIKPVDIVENLPDNCVALIDEGAMKYHAHKWNKKETEVMDRLISISGQRRQTFIFITHTMRKFAVTLLLDINCLFVKKPSLLQMKLERSEFRKLIEEIDREFNKIPKTDVKSSVYVVSDDFKGMIRNPLPEHWSQELSEAYAGIQIKEKEDKEETNGEYKPTRIDNGLKIWFKEEDKHFVLEVLSKNSTIDGTLSTMGIICTNNKCHYDFDLRLGKDGKYHITNNKFDIDKSIKELKEKKISFVVDIESAFPLTKNMVCFKPEKTKKEKNNLIEYAKKVKL